jgi:hypothetical protein
MSSNLKSISMIVTILAVIISSGLHLSYAEPRTSDHAIPAHAENLRESISSQLSAHKDWVLMESWNPTGAKIDYLGPAASNPHKIHGVAMAPTNLLDNGIAATSDTTSGSTSEWKETANFANQAISSTSVDLFQILDALSSDSAHWIQVGVVYDNANLINSTPSWHVAYDSFSTSSCSNTAEWFVSSGPQNFSSGDPIQSYIYADTSQPGHYVMGASDAKANTGTLYEFGISGDTGTNIKLGEADVSFCHYSAGPEQEEQSNGSTFTVSFSDEQYAMGYYDTPSSSLTTSVTNWNNLWGTNCVSLNPSPPPTNPASATFHYGC